MQQRIVGFEPRPDLTPEEPLFIHLMARPKEGMHRGTDLVRVEERQGAREKPPLPHQGMSRR